MLFTLGNMKCAMYIQIKMHFCLKMNEVYFYIYMCILFCMKKTSAVFPSKPVDFNIFDLMEEG
jgi:hypothetical protein